MKEATGEFSMTVVTIVAIVVIAGVIAVMRKPLTDFIQGTFTNSASGAVQDATQPPAGT